MKNVSNVKKNIGEYAVNSKLYYLKNQAAYTHKAWDKLIFNNVKNNFGGKVYII